MINLILKDLMEDYNPKWGEYCRTICLCILLLGDGMHLELKGKVLKNSYYLKISFLYIFIFLKGLVVMLLVLFAPAMEAISIAFLGIWLFSMNIALGLTLGFTISSAAPAIIVPPML